MEGSRTKYKEGTTEDFCDRELFSSPEEARLETNSKETFTNFCNRVEVVFSELLFTVPGEGVGGEWQKRWNVEGSVFKIYPSPPL